MFGIIATDSTGKALFVRTDSVPNVEGQAYGWFIGVGESSLPIPWIETLTSPAPNVSLSPDGRSAVVQGEGIPEYGVIYHFWIVAPGDPAGHYTIAVKLQDGRAERFSFELVTPGF